MTKWNIKIELSHSRPGRRVRSFAAAAFALLLLADPCQATSCRVILSPGASVRYNSLAGETFAIVYADTSQIKILRQTDTGEILGDDLPLKGGLADEDTTREILESLATVPQNRIFAFRPESAVSLLPGLNVNFKPLPVRSDWVDSSGWPLNLFKLVSNQLVRENMGQFARDLEPIYQKNKTAYEYLQPIFGPYLMQVDLRVRVKNESSIRRKLERKALEKNMRISSLQQAQEVIGDGIGFRIVLKEPRDSSQKPLRDLMNSIVNTLIRRIESGSIRVTEIHNYHAPGAKPYLNKNQLSRMLQAIGMAGEAMDLEIKQGSAFKTSGYTSLNLNLMLPSGIPAELQIRGEIIDRLAEIEHIYHDVRSNKVASQTGNANLNEFIDTLSRLNEAQRAELNNYLMRFYAYARWLEAQGSGPKTRLVRPKLPADLPQILSIEHAAAIQGLHF